MFIDLIAAKKVICHFKLDMHMFFIKSPVFSPAFKLFRDMTSLFFIALPCLQ